MFNFLKNWFSFSPSFGMGSLPIPADSRNIDIAQVQNPAAVPNFYITDIYDLGVNNQGSKPTCVGHSIAKLAEYYIFKKTGKVLKFDADALYNQCKKEDGIPEQQGTYASIAAKILIRDGIDQEYIDSNDKVATGYAFVPVDFDAICQAIYLNGMITLGLSIGSDWFRGIIGKTLRYIGGHQTDLHGYDKISKKLYGINSWGINWIGQIAGLIDQNVKPGFYVAKFEDIKDGVINIISILPISKNILDEVKNTGYRFLTTMRFGSRGFEVKKLQEKLNIIPADGIFGSNTKKKVMLYQSANLLVVDGIVGPAMRAKLNEGTKSFLPQWIEAIKQMEGAKPSRNNPGNLRFVGQQYAVNDNGFCKFDNYQHGYDALKNLLIRACTGKSSVYSPEMTLFEFYAGVYDPKHPGDSKYKKYPGYAPKEDENDPVRYSKFVAQRIGVPVETKIKNLI